MKNKLMEVSDVGRFFRDGMTIMFGGFMGTGTPPTLVKALEESGAKDLTIIGNDTAFADTGIGPLVTNGQVKKVIASHIGTNRSTGQRMIEGLTEVELVPQGTLVERIRCGGAGLGGFLTPTGVGTVVAEGKQVIEIDGREYLLELPLRADVALVNAAVADTAGNLRYRLSSRNFNPIIALAADIVLAEAGEIVEVGALAPDDVMTPAALVDGLIKGAA
ncbi:acetate CoA-transferase subunit alpha [Rhodobacteraceae bacterium RKSG542]|uniref:acetate CoA-transferase subunit alpha n=1 Tax=Pseudovibrio flavus TaxID=2529854 RepID=UPI0012BD5E92|nr:acetate CoA-transferase subunit alpha [Pseudovibrio flavus]MTI18025.1 acetate CoA-transferase subunit alpha [Pseudovibrio flavus]